MLSAFLRREEGIRDSWTPLGRQSLRKVLGPLAAPGISQGTYREAADLPGRIT
jgi:hypothetical protein